MLFTKNHANALFARQDPGYKCRFTFSFSKWSHKTRDDPMTGLLPEVGDNLGQIHSRRDMAQHNLEFATKMGNQTKAALLCAGFHLPK
jgi:hypothetical protein